MDTIKFKYNDYEKTIQFDKNLPLGDLIEKILALCNIAIFELERINIIQQNNESIAVGSENAQLNSTINSLNLNIDYLELVQRDGFNRTDNFAECTLGDAITGDFVLSDKYSNYLIMREDERLAQNLQNEYNDAYSSNYTYSGNNFFNLLNNILQQTDNHSTVNNMENSTDEDGTDEDGTNEEMPPLDTELDRFFDMIEETLSNPGSQNPNFTTTTNNGMTSFMVGNPNSQFYVGITSDILMNPNSVPTTLPSTPLTPFATLFSQLLGGQTTTGQPSLINTLSGLLSNQNLEDVKIVCTEDEIVQLKVIKFNDFKNTDICKSTQCNICLDEYTDDSDLMVLNCDHYFHDNCIKHWLTQDSNKCPLCRKEVSKGKAMI
jgi:hypothetical protein